MRIGIDARFAVRQPRRGIGTYSINFLKALAALNEQIEFILYIDEDDTEGVLPSGVNIKVRRLHPSIYPIWEQLALPVAAKLDKLDFLHALGNTAPLLLPKRTKLVLSLMDVMFLQTGRFVPIPKTLYQIVGRAYRSILVPFNARSADAIITISDFSRQDILKLINGLSPEKVMSMYLSCDPNFSLSSRSSVMNVRRPFVLCLGAEDPRKNTLRVVQAYLYALKNYNIEQDLVIIGYNNWEKSAAYCLVKSAKAESRVEFLSFISIENLIEMYTQATCLLYVSLYEGFGIPILEAFSCGCPVIASNSTSIPEVGGDAALYVDPRSVTEIAETVAHLCNDPVLQSDLKARGLERARKFSWEKVARETLEIYYRLFEI